MSKKEWDRDRVIIWRLEQMIERAEKLNEIKGEVKKHAEKYDRYIRVAGESYTLVSLSNVSPLLASGRGEQKKLEEVLNQINDPELKPVVKSKEQLKALKERRLQSYLIKEALLNERSLIVAFDINKNKLREEFTELLFAFDEVSLGDTDHEPIIRCDLLCVGVKEDKAFPVVLELKAESATSKKVWEELERQTRDFAKHVYNPKFSQLFARLLKAQTGLDVIEPTPQNVKKMVIVARDDYQGQSAGAYNARGMFRKMNAALSFSKKGEDKYSFQYIEA